MPKLVNQTKRRTRTARNSTSISHQSRARATGTLTKGQRTQARLIAAAIEEFAQRGYERTTIGQVVRRAGVSQPTFYLYFSSKIQIYKHLTTRVREELIEIIQRARLPPDMAQERAAENVRFAIESFLQYFSDNPKLATIGYFEAKSSSMIREEIAVFVSRNVASEQAVGYFRPTFDAQFLSHCYNGSLDRLIRQYLLTGKKTASELADLVADIYLNGMLPQISTATRPAASQ
jgi:TetR/AcrR family transcriptional regulator, fatty acid metabolism regulator protein